MPRTDHYSWQSIIHYSYHVQSKNASKISWDTDRLCPCPKKHIKILLTCLYPIVTYGAVSRLAAQKSRTLLTFSQSKMGSISQTWVNSSSRGMLSS